MSAVAFGTMDTDDDVVGAWERLMGGRGQWREEMRPILAAHRDELPFPEDIAGYHGFELRPDRPFPADEFPTATAWLWEGEERPDEDLLTRTHGWVPLRHYGCGGGIVRNVDITPGPRRKTYDAYVHTFPVGQHRRVETIERTGVPADALGALLTDADAEGR